jgi:hypothetical protein
MQDSKEDLFAKHDEARIRLKQVFEMPNQAADRIIRSLGQHGGQVSDDLLKLYPTIFGDQEISAEAVEAVMSVLNCPDIKTKFGLKSRELDWDGR